LAAGQTPMRERLSLCLLLSADHLLIIPCLLRGVILLCRYASLLKIIPSLFTVIKLNVLYFIIKHYRSIAKRALHLLDVLRRFKRAAALRTN